MSRLNPERSEAENVFDMLESIARGDRADRAVARRHVRE
jgi:hypothetical protein